MHRHGVTIMGRRFLRLRGITAASVGLVLAAALVASATTVAKADPPPPTPADALTTLFGSYGDASGRWAGGDGTVSVPLPDGRVAWFFSDTFVGPVNADHSLPAGTPMVRNSLVVQNGSQLVSTLPAGAATLVPTGVANEVYWVGGAVIEGSSVKMIYKRIRTGTQPLDLTPIGVAVATFSLPDLTLQSVAPVNVPANVSWGSAVVTAGGYTYIYGTEGVSPTSKFAHVARVPVGGLSGAWQFWDGTTWSSDPSASARLLSGVGDNFGVQLVGGQYVLVTMDTNLLFDSRVVAYTAPAPTGPFTGPIQLFAASFPDPGSGPARPLIVYNAQLHPEQAAANTLLVSYDMNSVQPSDLQSDITIYRPRFVQVTWPRPQPDPATLPAAPTNLAASADSSGVVHLQWQAPAGLTFNAYLRDVTAGQTFPALLESTSNTSVDIGQLANNHTYEFAVAATNASGEGPMSDVVSQTISVAPPPAPTGVTASADQAGHITVSWSAVPGATSYAVQRRDLTAGDTAPTTVASVIPATTWTTPDNDLTNQHQYEFTVTASHAVGESPPSAAVTATAYYPPPAPPTGLTATANTADGTIALAWTPPAGTPDVWYFVYQRDVTAGDTDFTELPLPITTGPSMTAGLLANGHTYEYKVSATNRGGEGPTSTVASATSTYPVPTAPTNLVASPADGGATLTWTKTTSFDTWYLIYERDVTAGETDFTQLPLPLTTCCTFSPTMLTNGHTYEFQVAATATGGVSPASATVSVTPVPPLAGAPTAVTAAPNPDGSITLTWTPPDGGPYWTMVYQRDKTANDANFTELAYPVTTCCSVQLGGGFNANNHEYEYKLTELNSVGAEGAQSTVTSAVAHYDPPAPPTNLRGVSTGDGNITLDWDAPPNYYYIYFRDATAGQDWQKSAYPTGSLTVSWGLLVNGDTYEFKVTADNLGGESDYSSTIQVTSYGGLPQPATNLRTKPGDGQIELDWDPSSTSNTGYIISGRDATKNESFHDMPGYANCCTWTGLYLIDGDRYEYRVTASNAAGRSTTSALISATPMPPVPAAPTGLQIGTTGDGHVGLSWNASTTGGVYYLIDVKAGNGSWQELPLPVTTCCSIDVQYLTNFTSYQFRVYSTNMAGDSPAPSNVVTATPVPPRPDPPTNLIAAAHDGYVTLHWNPSPTTGVLYWVEMRQHLGGGDFHALQYPVKCCGLDVQYLMNGTTYDFRLRSTNGYASDPTAYVTAKPMPPLPGPPTVDAVQSYDPYNGGRIHVHWVPSITPWVSYSVWAKLAGAPDKTWRQIATNVPNNQYDFYFPSYRGELYDLQVEASNMSGNAWSDVKTAMARDSAPQQTRHFVNDWVNGANPNAAGLEGLAALTHPNQYCSDARGFQHICYNYPWQLSGNIFTIGDWQMYPSSEANLTHRLECEAVIRANMRKMGVSDLNVDQYGPDVFRHEERHSIQYTWYLSVESFLAAYVVARDAFESDANKYWGGQIYFSDGLWTVADVYYATLGCDGVHIP
jgi:fibronectin type 3 domain-containing protein